MALSSILREEAKDEASNHLYCYSINVRGLQLPPASGSGVVGQILMSNGDGTFRWVYPPRSQTIVWGGPVAAGATGTVYFRVTQPFGGTNAPSAEGGATWGVPEFPSTVSLVSWSNGAASAATTLGIYKNSVQVGSFQMLPTTNRTGTTAIPTLTFAPGDRVSVSWDTTLGLTPINLQAWMTFTEIV